jgi:hypothetical protein
MKSEPAIIDVDVDAQVGVRFGSQRHFDTARTHRQVVVAEARVAAEGPMVPVVGRQGSTVGSAGSSDSEGYVR